MSGASNHYGLPDGRECIDIIRELGWLEDFCRGNVLKYIVRYKAKGGLEDLHKAKTYIDFLIKNETLEEHD